MHCLKIEEFSLITSTPNYCCQAITCGNKIKELYWENTNKLLEIPGYQGIKAGFTTNAGACLCCSYFLNEK